MVNRILELRKLERLSQKEFAKVISISQAALSQIECGKTSMSVGTLYSVIDKFKLNAEWMLFGMGPIYKEKMISIAHGSPIVEKSDGEATLISYVEQDAEAGYLDNWQDTEYIQSLGGYRIPGFEDGNFRMFQISGDSMNPSLYEDDIVISELVDEIGNIQANRQCVIVTKEGIVAKRVFPHSSHKLLLKSDNPKYKSYKIDYDNIFELWEIKAKVTTEFLSPPINSQMSDDIDKRIEALENTVNMLTVALKNNGNSNGKG